MKPSLGMKSILLFALSIVLLILLTLFETSLVGLAMATERIISLLLLVLPGVIGVVRCDRDCAERTQNLDRISWHFA
jgi:hypothetical protein